MTLTKRLVRENKDSGYKVYALEHRCEHPGCTRWGAFGFGVDLLRKTVGRWYCRDHKAAGELIPLINQVNPWLNDNTANTPAPAPAAASPSPAEPDKPASSPARPPASITTTPDLFSLTG
jgi:hypothetical protein